MVLVGASVWSLALRRRPAALSAAEDHLVGEWAGIVAEGPRGGGQSFEKSISSACVQSSALPAPILARTSCKNS